MKRLGKVLLVLIALLAVAFLAFRTPDTDPAAMKAKYGAAPSQFVDLGGGLTVHLRDEGPRDAPVIMLLHGSNADLHTWEPWAAALRSDYRVIRFDTVGHGLTGGAPDKDYTAEAMAGLVGRVADKLGLGKFVLGGNSMGGGISVAYALEHQDRLSGLVLVDAGGAPKPGGEPGNIGFKLAATPGVNNIIGQITPRWLVEQSLSQSVTNQAIVTPAAVDRYWELLRFPGNREATMIRFATPRRTFDPAKLATITVPTLVLWGEEDKLIGPDAARWYAKAISSSKLVIYPGIGHLPQEEAPQATLTDLKAWLMSQSAKGKTG